MPDNPEPQPQSSPETKDSNVVVKNNAQYDVNIYVDKSPYYDILPNFTVKAGASHSCKLPVLEDTVETVFYIEYIIDIGNAKFTYRTLETQGYKNLLIKENEQATFTIALDKTGGDETTSEVTYEESTVVGGWEVGPKANTVAVQTATLLGGELYTLVVSGPSYDDISCAYKGGNDNPEHAKMSID